jgi:acetyl esterase/lipase
VKGVWVRPAAHLIVGDVKRWAEDAHVECNRIPAYWIEKKGVNRMPGAPPKVGEKVLYHLHGGAYIEHSAHPSDITAHIVHGIMERTPIKRTFSLEYRLTKGPPKNALEHPFPAALLDAIAGYDHLVNMVGFAPKDIIVEGDSAGGNLAIALVRYLVENANDPQVALPSPPAALILCSPWVYMGSLDLPKKSPLRKTSSVYYNRNSDFINIAGKATDNIMKNFFGPLGVAAGRNNRYISPASDSLKRESASFKGFPPTFILGGGAEVMIDQIRVFATMMREDLGQGKVEFLEQPDALHDFLVFPWHEPERTESLDRIAKWLFPDNTEAKGRWWLPKARL